MKINAAMEENNPIIFPKPTHINIEITLAERIKE